MKILNIMLSRTLGGIQQSFLDYNKIIREAGYEDIAITSSGAEVHNKLITSKHYTLPNYFSFDPISKLLLFKIILKEKPQLIIAHGKRAIMFALSARRFLKDKVEIIAVAHNYWFKPLLLCDYIFSITSHLKDFLVDKGAQPSRIFIMPNSIDTNLYNFSDKEVVSEKLLRIGTLARLIHKKGVDVFIEALALLRVQQINFKAFIGGEGEELEKLKNLAAINGLDANVEFIGWVHDKNEFFKKIDIFCLPSRHEPFGIIILEAMMSKTPLIATRSEGPLEILTHEEDALLVDIESAEQIANSAIKLYEDKKYSVRLVKTAFLRVVQNYDINSAAERLKKYIKVIQENVI